MLIILAPDVYLLYSHASLCLTGMSLSSDRLAFTGNRLMAGACKKY
jgi:hypothetical protein